MENRVGMQDDIFPVEFRYYLVVQTLAAGVQVINFAVKMKLLVVLEIVGEKNVYRLANCYSHMHLLSSSILH